MFGAVTFGLVFGADTNPDANRFIQGMVVLHTLLHGKERKPNQAEIEIFRDNI